MRIRRSPHALLYLEDEYLLDFESLRRAERPPTAPEAGIVALAILTGERHRLGRGELDLLLSVPAEEWVDADGRNQGVIRDLTEKGLLLSDSEDRALSHLRERDEALSANAWNIYAALYHYMTQWTALTAAKASTTRRGSQNATAWRVATTSRPTANRRRRSPSRTRA